MKYLLIVFVLFFTACSSSKSPNTWEKSSALSTKSYIDYFLQDRELLANSEYTRAVTNAKQSASVDTLAKIYLTQCALNRAVYIEDDCSEYIELEHLIEDSTLKNYFYFITHKPFESASLPQQYQKFAQETDIEKKKAALFEIEPLSSQLVAAATIKETLNDQDVLLLLKKSSYYGYRRVNIVLLKHLSMTTKDKKLQKESLAKLEILR